MAPHILRIPSHPSHASHPPHILRYAVYVRGYRDSVFQAPRTYYASLRMYGVTEIASSRRTKQKKASDCSDAFSILGNINYP